MLLVNPGKWHSRGARGNANPLLPSGRMLKKGACVSSPVATGSLTLNLMKNTSFFKQMEKRLRELIEVRLGHILDGQVQPHMIAQKLTEALEGNIQYNAGKFEAPDQYWVVLNADTLETVLQKNQSLAAELSNQLIVLIRESEFRTNHVPTVRLVGDGNLLSHEIQVRAEYSSRERERTQAMDRLEVEPSDEIPADAHLILNDGTQFYLTLPIVNIGRHPTNHIVVSSPVVSRRHCQLRLRFGSYYLYDMQSRSGTRVNGYLIQEHRLSAGDVISFGDIQLIYIADENPTGELAGDTQVPGNE